MITPSLSLNFATTSPPDNVEKKAAMLKKTGYKFISRQHLHLKLLKSLNYTSSAKVGHFGPGDNGYIGLQSPAFSVKCEVLPAASILRFRFYRGNGRQTEVVFHLPYLAEEMKERAMKIAFWVRAKRICCPKTSLMPPVMCFSPGGQPACLWSDRASDWTDAPGQ